MPQHDRKGPLWTLRRLQRRAQRERELRRHPGIVATDRPLTVADETGGGDHPSTTLEASDPDHPLTTVEATIQPGSGRFYRTLTFGVGEPYLLRPAPGVVADDDRVRARRSLLYFAHHTDVHLCDAQSPSRLEVGERLAFLEPGTDAGHRPQEHATVHVFDQMIRATNRVSTSPLSNADMDFLILTGDNTDNRQYCELRWFIDTLDGLAVTPNTGGRFYEGAQASPDYHPDDPSNDVYGRFGFPHVPGLLASSIQPFHTTGSVVPWLTVLGNHDVIWQGTFGNRGRIRLGDTGERLSVSASKPNRLWSLLVSITAQHLGDSGGARVLEGLAARRTTTVTADLLARRQLPLAEYLAEYFVTESAPGPVGHGFTEENLRSGTAFWARPAGDHFLLIGLDTNNHVSGSEGRIGPQQVRWLTERLEGARDANRLVIVFSHHNSKTMTNAVDDHDDPGRPTHGDELVALLAASRNVILWVNGHDHENRILHHRDDRGGASKRGRDRRDGGGHGGGHGARRTLGDRGGGFWEVTTASCIDFGQQSRTIEMMDNGDGTLSIVVTVVDHAAPLSVALRRGGAYDPAQIASLSREFASNDSRWIDPWEQRGDEGDRNVELLIRDPRTA